MRCACEPPPKCLQTFWRKKETWPGLHERGTSSNLHEFTPNLRDVFSQTQSYQVSDAKTVIGLYQRPASRRRGRDAMDDGAAKTRVAVGGRETSVLLMECVCFLMCFTLIISIFQCVIRCNKLFPMG